VIFLLGSNLEFSSHIGKFIQEKIQILHYGKTGNKSMVEYLLYNFYFTSGLHYFSKKQNSKKIFLCKYYEVDNGTQGAIEIKSLTVVQIK